MRGPSCSSDWNSASRAWGLGTGIGVRMGMAAVQSLQLWVLVPHSRPSTLPTPCRTTDLGYATTGLERSIPTQWIRDHHRVVAGGCCPLEYYHTRGWMCSAFTLRTHTTAPNPRHSFYSPSLLANLAQGVLPYPCFRSVFDYGASKANWYQPMQKIRNTTSPLVIKPRKKITTPFSP